ncbi:MAG: Trk system potassium transporter TrkA [Fibrobacter sp.]|nr:Trk system potassium transporter TrkA [Fibrobacter sp.]
MKAIIIGAGALGLGLADFLNRFEHQVSIVEKNSSLVSEISSRFDALVVAGSGSSPAALEEAGIETADMVIAVTPSDEVNLLACQFAAQYGVPKRIARIVSHEFTNRKSKIDIEKVGVTDIIETEKELVNNICQYIELPGITDTANFHNGNVYLRGYKITEDMPVAGKSLFELRELVGSAPMLIVAIIRNGKSIIPSGAERLLPGDETITMMPRESYQAYRELINRPSQRLKKVIISGDSLFAIHIADVLSELAERVILVDPDPEHGQEAASQLNGVEVLSGDATNSDLLQELHVESADFFIAAGKDMEDNIMSCLLAKAENAKEVIALRTDERHLDLFVSLGIDHVISPRQITLQRILENVQIAPIGSLLKLKKADLDIVWVVTRKHSSVVGKPLSKLDNLLKKEIIIGAIVRNNDIIIPGGDTIIEEGDEVLVLCHRGNIAAVNRAFRSGFKF